MATLCEHDFTSENVYYAVTLVLSVYEIKDHTMIKIKCFQNVFDMENIAVTLHDAYNF